LALTILQGFGKPILFLASIAVYANFHYRTEKFTTVQKNSLPYRKSGSEVIHSI